MQSEITSLHEAERKAKEEELRTARESQAVVTGLERDLQQILDDKRTELKVRVVYINLSINCSIIGIHIFISVWRWLRSQSFQISQQSFLFLSIYFMLLFPAFGVMRFAPIAKLKQGLRSELQLDVLTVTANEFSKILLLFP